MLTPLQCPGCGGLLRSLDARVWQCAYCESRYMLLGEADPELGLTRVGQTGPEIVWWDGIGRWKGKIWKEVNALHVGGAFDQDVDPYTGMIVSTEVSELQVAQLKARMAIDSFGRKFGRPRPQPKAQPIQHILR